MGIGEEFYSCSRRVDGWFGVGKGCVIDRSTVGIGFRLGLVG